MDLKRMFILMGSPSLRIHVGFDLNVSSMSSISSGPRFRLWFRIIHLGVGGEDLWNVSMRHTLVQLVLIRSTSSSNQPCNSYMAIWYTLVERSPSSSSFIRLLGSTRRCLHCCVNRRTKRIAFEYVA